MIKRFFLVLILTIMSISAESTEQTEEQENAVTELSAMLIDLIGKYDVSGAG